MKRCSLVYKMAKWNQLVKNGNAINTDNWTTNNSSISASDNTMTIVKDSGSNYGGRCYQYFPKDITHKYLLTCFGKSEGSSISIAFCKTDMTGGGNQSTTETTSIYKQLWLITSPVRATDVMHISAGISTDPAGVKAYFRNAMCIDLTDIFGAGNEPTTYEAARTAILAEVGIDISGYHNYDAGSTIVRRAKLASESGAIMKRSALVLPKLPREYQEVTHIASDSSAYIDTGYKANLNTKIECVLRNVGTAGDVYYLFGARDGNNNNACMFGTTAAYFYPQFDSVARNVISNPSVDTNKHKVVLSKDGCYFDGLLIATFPSATTFESKNILICASNDGGIIRASASEYDYFDILDNGILVRNFIPCYRKSDNTIGLYDLCGSICSLTNSPFYINSGTGTFTKGPNVY